MENDGTVVGQRMQIPAGQLSPPTNHAGSHEPATGAMLDRAVLDRAGLDRAGLDRAGLDRSGLDRAVLDFNATSSTRLEPQRQARSITLRPLVPVTDAELRARVQWSTVASNHFVLSVDKLLFSPSQTESLVLLLEQAYTSIFSLTHEAFPDRFHIYAADLSSPSLLGRSLQSHVNLEEPAVYIVRKSSLPVHVDLIALVSHAMRLPRLLRHYGKTSGWAMLEDAFGMFLNSRLSMYPEVFPFYGLEPDIIAQRLIARSPDSLLTHSWLSPAFAASPDRYVLSGAFFLYLGDTFSDDRVVEFSKCDSEITASSFREFFGASLDDLERQWRDHLPTALLAHTKEELEHTQTAWERSIEARS